MRNMLETLRPCLKDQFFTLVMGFLRNFRYPLSASQLLM